jgi:hypothetical protein
MFRWIAWLLLMMAGPARALPYELAPGSTITASDGPTAALTGSFELAFTGICTLPVDPPSCLLRYRVEALALSGGGESLVLADPLPPLPGPFVPTLFDLEIPLPDPAVLSEFVFERDSEPGPVSGVVLIHDRALRTPAVNTAPASVFHGDFFPSRLFLELELLEVERRSVDPDAFPTTLSSDVVATLSLTAVPIPEPATAALTGVGLAGLAAWSRRRRGPRRLAKVSAGVRCFHAMTSNSCDGSPNGSET